MVDSPRRLHPVGATHLQKVKIARRSEVVFGGCGGTHYGRRKDLSASNACVSAFFFPTRSGMPIPSRLLFSIFISKERFGLKIIYYSDGLL
jgi:hypothetical protein